MWIPAFAGMTYLNKSNVNIKSKLFLNFQIQKKKVNLHSKFLIIYFKFLIPNS